MLQLFPQAIESLPNNRALFTARSSDLTPLWTRLVNGVVQPNGSVALAFASGGPSDTVQSLDSGQQLVGGVGWFEFTMDLGCLPVTTGVGGVFSWTAYFGGGWEYRVEVEPSTIDIRDEANTLLESIPYNVAIGDKFRVELSNGFRLFVNGELKHERVTGFTTGISYPAFYGQVSVTKPSSTGTGDPAIPAPLLSGDWRLREIDRLGNAIVAFTAPTEGTITADGLSVEYSDGEVPGAYKLTAQIDPGSDTWMEDAVPAGATQGTLNGDAWTFGNTNPTPNTGNQRHKSNNVAGDHAHYFFNATDTLQILPGDTLYCDVFPDATNPPTEIMLSWGTTTEAGQHPHRAYWGANSINDGTNGTSSRRFMGPLPPLGQWTRLEVPASLVALEGTVVSGMSFRLFDGVCSFDQAGKIPNLQGAEALITIPPLRILGDSVRTLEPGEAVRFQTNYDVADTPPTWSIVYGGGSFTQGEFTAPATPGITLIRATAATGNQIAEITVVTLPTITPALFAAGPSEQIDFNTNIPVLPLFVAAGALAEGTGAIVPGLPVGMQPGDILLLFVETANEAVTAPTGYAAVADSPQGTGTAAGATATRISVFWKRAVVGETAPTVADPGEHAIGQILAFRNCIGSGNPWDVTAGNTGASSTSVSIPGDTTTLPNCLIVQAVAHQTDTAAAQVSGYANADLVNLTERADVSTTQGNGGGFAVVTGEKATAGAFGATTATLAGASVQGRITIALKPAVSVWTASAGSINSTSGLWTAPSLVGQTARITVTNGFFTATRDVLILPIFPLDNPSAPLTVDLNKTVLISISEDRSSYVSRVKDKDGRSYRTQEVTFNNSELSELEQVVTFWESNYPGKRFILEDNLRGTRIVCFFDSSLRYEAESNCAVNISFRIREA